MKKQYVLFVLTLGGAVSLCASNWEEFMHEGPYKGMAAPVEGKTEQVRGLSSAVSLADLGMFQSQPAKTPMSVRVVPDVESGSVQGLEEGHLEIPEAPITTPSQELAVHLNRFILLGAQARTPSPSKRSRLQTLLEDFAEEALKHPEQLQAVLEKNPDKCARLRGLLSGSEQSSVEASPEMRRRDGSPKKRRSFQGDVSDLVPNASAEGQRRRADSLGLMVKAQA